MLHTIKRGETISEIAEMYDVDDYEKDIWNHNINKIIKKYWPRGISTTYDQLPIGQSLYVPGNDYITDTVEKDKKNQYVTRQSLKGDLHLKICNFKEYKAFGYPLKELPKVFRLEFKNELVPPEKELSIQQENGFFGMLSGADWETNQELRNTENGPFCYNRGKLHHYYFDERTGRTRITWKTKTQLFRCTSPDWVDDYNEEVPRVSQWGQVMGDKRKRKPMSDGYVYIFRGDDDSSLELTAAYHVFSKIYQKVNVSASEDHTRSGEPAAEYIKIKDFFPSNNEELIDQDFYKFNYVYTSKIPLTWKTLCGNGDKSLSTTVASLGFDLIQVPLRLLNKEQYHPSSAHIKFLKYYSKTYKVKKKYALREQDDIVFDPARYYHRLERIGGKLGYSVTIPEIEDEAIRKNDEYRERFVKYTQWKDNDIREDKTFFYGVVNHLLKKGKIDGDHIDLESLGNYKTFQREETKNHARYALPTERAAVDLVNFICDPRFVQVMINYSQRNETPDSSGKDYSTLLFELLAKIHEELVFWPVGFKFIHDMWRDPRSYFNQLLNPEKLPKLKGLIFDSDEHKFIKPQKTMFPESIPENTKLLTAIKVHNSAISHFVGKFLPVVFKELTEESKNKLVERISKYYSLNQPSTLAKRLAKEEKRLKSPAWNQKALRRRIKALREKIERDVEAKKLKKIRMFDAAGKKLDKVTKPVTSKIGGAGDNISTIVHTIIFFHSASVFINDDDKDFNDVVTMVGVTLDLFCALDDTQLTKTYILRGGAKYVPYANIFSCAIDAYNAVRSMEEAFNEDEDIVAIAFGTLAVGKIIVGAGSVAYLAGASALAATGIGLVGIAIIAVATIIIHCTDTEVQKWAMACYFGTKRKSGDILDQKEAKEQIDAITNMLSKFKVSGSFYDFIGAPDWLTCLSLEIEPRLITNETEIIIKGLMIQGLNKTFEFSKKRQEEFKINPKDPDAIKTIELKVGDFGSTDKSSMYYGVGALGAKPLKSVKINEYCEAEMHVGVKNINKITLNLRFKKDVDFAEGWMTLRIKHPITNLTNIQDEERYQFKYTTKFTVGTLPKSDSDHERDIPVMGRLL